MRILTVRNGTRRQTGRAMPTFRRGDVVKVPIPSVIRTAKIATIESADATKLGRISAKAMKQVSREVGRLVELE